MNNRLYDLLDEYDLKDRYISNATDLLNLTGNYVDYKEVDAKLIANRNKSIEFIKDCIGYE